MQQPFLHFSLIELFLFLGFYNSSEKHAIDGWTLVLHDFSPRYVRPSVGWSVSRSVGWLVTFYFSLRSCNLWPHCSCPNALVTQNMAPAHPHATGVAVYPTLFFSKMPFFPPCFFSSQKCHCFELQDTFLFKGLSKA